MAHLDIRVIEPESAALPITTTGYLSHFFNPEKTLTEEALITHVQDWLDAEAQAPKWQAFEREQQQLTLF